jgi:hypothetical protein
MASKRKKQRAHVEERARFFVSEAHHALTRDSLEILINEAQTDTQRVERLCELLRDGAMGLRPLTEVYADLRKLVEQRKD